MARPRTGFVLYCICCRFNGGWGAHLALPGVGFLLGVDPFEFQPWGCVMKIWSCLFSLFLLLLNFSSALSADQITTDPAADSQPCWSPANDYIAFVSNRSGNYDIWVIPVAGGEAIQITTDPAGEWSPAWSPDGSMLVFNSYRTGGGDIYTKPLAGGPATQVTTDPANEWMPVWSPDGSQIGFTSERSGNYDIWVIPASGGTATQITTDPASDRRLSWSPDGSQFAFQTDRGGDTDIWLIPSSGGVATPFTDHAADEHSPAWSPDGSLIAFRSTRSGNPDIWIKPLVGGDAIQATTELSTEAMPTWSPSGTKIAYHSDLSGNSDIWVADFNISGTIDDVVRAGLRGNYPNPFNPSTTIVFELRESSEVMLQLFDVKGQLVNTLASSFMSPGSYQKIWDGTNLSGREVASGVYFVQLRTGDLLQTRKISLIK